MFVNSVDVMYSFVFVMCLCLRGVWDFFALVLVLCILFGDLVCLLVMCWLWVSWVMLVELVALVDRCVLGFGYFGLGVCG